MPHPTSQTLPMPLEIETTAAHRLHELEYSDAYGA